MRVIARSHSVAAMDLKGDPTIQSYTNLKWDHTLVEKPTKFLLMRKNK